MSKDSKIVTVKFRDHTTIGHGNEWTISDPYGYTVSEEGNDIVFTRPPADGKIGRIRVPRENVAQIFEEIDAPPPAAKAGAKAGGKDAP